MIILGLAVVLFAVLHLVPVLPGGKEWAMARVGRKAYGAAYGIASLVALSFIVVGWRSSDFVPVYEPAPWARYANFGLTLVAFLSLGVFLFRGALRQRLRFPLGIAVLFWASGHLLANGDLRSLILFGGMAIYAALHVALGWVQGVRPSGEMRDGHDLLSLMAGLALYGLMTQLHYALIGVRIFQLSG